MSGFLHSWLHKGSIHISLEEENPLTRQSFSAFHSELAFLTGVARQ